MTFRGSTSAESAISATAEAADMAHRAGLVYVSDTLPGYRRERFGKRFRYLLPDDRVLKSRVELKRIAQLAIPPAYEDVWVCMDPRGHL
jgi:DNA topoisomerase I